VQIAKPDVVLVSGTRKYTVFSMDSSLSPLGAKPTALGKDEVGGSNPPSSSKKLRELRFSELFPFFNQNPDRIPVPQQNPPQNQILRRVCALSANEVSGFESMKNGLPVKESWSCGASYAILL